MIQFLLAERAACSGGGDSGGSQVSGEGGSMRPGPALLLLGLGLGLGLRLGLHLGLHLDRGRLPQPPAPPRARASVLLPGRHGDATALRTWRGALGPGEPTGSARLRLRPRGAWPGTGRCCLPRSPARRLCVQVRALLRAHLASAPSRVHLQPCTFGPQLGRASAPRRLRRSALEPATDGPRPYPGLVAKTRCPTDGPTPVALEAVNSTGPAAGESSVSCKLSADNPCLVQEVKISRNQEGVPVLLNRNKGDTFNASFKWYCPSTTFILPQWQVFSVSSASEVPDWSKPLDVPELQSEINPARLYVPAKSLAWGMYVFNFSLTFYVHRNRTIAAVGSDILYVNITRSDLKAVIAGNPNIMINFTDRLLLNGSGSSDPDSDNPLEGLIFSWYCTTERKQYQGARITVMSNKVCIPHSANLRWPRASGPVLKIPPGTLKGGGVYFFRLVIRKGSRKGFVDRTVHVLKGPAPVASISCIENCDAVLIISDRFSLFLNCTNCSSGLDLYEWSLLSSNGSQLPFDWVRHTTTGNTSAYLTLKAFVFRNFSEAQFWISGHIASWSGHDLHFRHSFVINRVPQIGHCTIDPPNGVSFLTKFVIQCQNFKDNNIPLTYKIIVSDLHGFGQISSVKENSLGAILYLGNQSTAPPSFLPVGMLENHYAMKIYVQVYDSLGAFSQVTLYSTVHAPTDKISEKDVLDLLFNFTMGTNSSLSALLQNREFLPAGYLIFIAASVLNSLKHELTLQADKARLQEYLVNQTFILPNSTLVEISQVVMSIAKLTQTTSGCTLMAQKLATVRIWQANQALQQSRQKDAHRYSEQIEIMSTGILTSLSNIIKMIVSYEVVDEPFYEMELLADTILDSKVPGNETTALMASSLNMYIRKTEKWGVTNAFGNQLTSRNYFNPTLNVSSVPSLPANAPISIMFCEFVDDPFPWLKYQENYSVEVVGFRMTGTTPSGSVIEIVPDIAEVYITRKNLSFAAFNLTMGPSNEPGKVEESLKRTTGEFSFEVDSSVVKEVLIHIVTEVTVVFTVLVYAGSQITPSALVATFFVPYDIPPVANQSDLFDSACTVKEARVVCIPPSLLQVIAQRSGSTECAMIIVLQAPRFVMVPSVKLVRIALFGAYCLDMYGIQSDWREDTCVLGEKTTWSRVHCICKHSGRARRQLDAIKKAGKHLQTHFLTAKVIVIPNAVDLRLEVIKNVTQNPVTLFTVLFIMLMYLILAFWALHRDGMDRFLRHQVIIILDNDPYDKVCYLITIFTGSRCRSGTRANVFIQLKGTEGDSDVHCLSHPYFTTLRRGNINSFLLTTKSDLGDIHSIRVWHNNEGRAPSWYLSRIKVENVFSRQIWLFMCRRWFSIDTSLDRTFPVTHPDQPLNKMDFFLIDSIYKLGRNHTWFSIFSSVVARPFNRLQRLSCCLAMLMASLLCNIMFFNLNAEDETEPEERRYIRSMMIGLESVLITIPVQLLVDFLFTYSQREPRVALEEAAPRKHSLVPISEHWEEYLEKWHALEMVDARTKVALKLPPGKSARPQEASAKVPPVALHPHKKGQSKVSGPQKKKTKASNQNAKDNQNQNAQNVTMTEPSLMVSHLEINKKYRVILPWYCVYLAWVLIFITSSIASFFIVFYGLTYGFDKSIEWLFASFCSFCLSVFLVQPSKIVFLSALRANWPKYCKNLSWTSGYCYTEIKLHSRSFSPEELQKRHVQILQLRNSRMYQPLTEDEIRIFQRKKRIKRRAFLFLSYILTHFIFLALLLSLLALLRHTDSFYYNQFIRDQFSVDLSSVTKLADIYRWLNSVLVPLFHNEQDPTYLPDSSSKILGLPLLRQVRAKPGDKLCPPAKSFAQTGMEREIRCHPSYGTDMEDTRNYTDLWNTVTKRAVDKNTNGFTYKPPEKVWVYFSHGLLHTYGSGGYAFYFFPEQQQFNSTVRLRNLQSSDWLDEKTWAVILELTTFNPDVSLFCSISVIFEVSQLGVVNTSISVHSFSLADFNRETSAEIYLYVAILIFFLAYVFDEVYVILQERTSYVRSVYNLLNFALKCIFTVLIVLFFQKNFLATGIIRSYLSNPDDFIPFHSVSQVDHVMRIILGFLLFLTILKTLRYSRFFYDVRLAQRAIQTALPGICHMALVVSVYCFVYMAFGYLVFGQHEWNYSNLVHATQTIFSYCVSAFQNTEFSNNRVLGVLFLSSFMLVMICILINLFQAVILSAYEEMKQPVYEEPSDEAEAMTYLCRKLRAMFRFLTFQPKDEDEPEFFVDMLYGQPEKNSRRYLGLKTRNINGKKMVYLVV
ncbi:polycystin family receptor for egg jelly [Vulpes vulpes]|uniref:Polycystin family receptor for egg jelly n=1 Tax=Vulpes vulpes TaxID=9627 RepID=A0ABM4Z598_VULVU